ncbi:MAG: ABC transporter permease [Acidimicrobiales bacterium]
MLLANREMQRSKLKFGLLSGAVGLLIFLVFFQQTLLGSLLQSFTGAIQNQSADVLVLAGDARKSLDASFVTTDTVAQVAAVDGVAQASPLGEATVTMIAGGKTLDVAVFGVDPSAAGAPTRLVSGRLPAQSGEGVASSEDEDKGLAIGDLVRTATGDATVTIVGLTDQSQFNVQPTLFVPFETYTALRRAANPAAGAIGPSAVAVVVADGASPREVADRIDAQVAGVQALTRTEAVDNAPGVSSVQVSFGLILALAIAVVALVTGFFFLILTVQKAQALTLLRAIGAPAGYLVRSLLQQVAVVLSVAFVVALLLTFGAVAGSSTGLALTVDPQALLTSGAIIVALSLIGSLAAIWRVLRIDPVQAVTRQNLGGTE